MGDARSTKNTQTSYGSAALFFFYSSVLVATMLPSQILMRSNWFVCHWPPLGGALVSPGFIVPQNSEVGTRLEFFGQKKSRSEGGARVEGRVVAPTLFSLSGVQDEAALPERLPFCFLIKDRCSRSHYILFCAKGFLKLQEVVILGIRTRDSISCSRTQKKSTLFQRGRFLFQSAMFDAILSPKKHDLFFSGFAPTPSAGGAKL